MCHHITKHRPLTTTVLNILKNGNLQFNIMVFAPSLTLWCHAAIEVSKNKQPDMHKCKNGGGVCNYLYSLKVGRNLVAQSVSHSSGEQSNDNWWENSSLFLFGSTRPGSLRVYLIISYLFFIIDLFIITSPTSSLSSSLFSSPRWQILALPNV